MGMRIGSLFSGIGGLELGLETAGLGTTVWHSEIDPYCARVLEARFPGVPNLGDIHGITDPPAVDLLCGGFPCQPVSSAGKRLAQDDPRWLWPEFQRIIDITRPAIVVAENVPGLRTRGLGLVLEGLADVGYDAEWIRLSAAAVGAPHLRERLFIVAYPSGSRRWQDPGSPHEDEGEHEGWGQKEDHQSSSDGQGGGAGEVPGDVAHTDSYQKIGPSITWKESCAWADEPVVARVAHGVPSRVDRNRALGNAVVPQCSEFVGLCIRRALNA